MSKRINIILPEATASVLDRLTSKGNRSRFIDQAVLHYIETHSRESLIGQLKAGYRANADRDPSVAAEWFPLEEEALRTSSYASSTPAKKRPRSKRT